MSYVKVDSAILTSSLWQDPDACRVFLTALLMAYPVEVMEPLPEIGIGTLKETGFMVPPGWYGFVEAAGPGLTHSACLEREPGQAALRRLSSPDEESRGKEYDGRRLVRVDGGFVVLNYMKYREKDHTTAERSKRYRDRRKGESTRRDDRDATVTHRDAGAKTRSVTRDVTEADAVVQVQADLGTSKDLANKQNLGSTHTRSLELAQNARERLNGHDAVFEAFWTRYPRKVAKSAALKTWNRLKPDEPVVAEILKGLAWQVKQPQWTKDGGRFIPHASTWLNQRRWQDEPSTLEDPTDAAWERVMHGKGVLQ